MSEEITKELREYLYDHIMRPKAFTPSEILAIADRIDKAHEKGARDAYQEGVDAGTLRVADMDEDDPWLLENGLVRMTWHPDSPDPEGIAQLESWANNSGKVTPDARDRILGMCRSIRVEWRAKLAKQCDAAAAEATAKLTANLPTFDEEAAELSDEYLADHGLVRLPVDADGKPWHVGDRIRSLHEPDECIEYLSYFGDDHWEYDAQHTDGPIGDLKRYVPTPAERIRALLPELEIGKEPDPGYLMSTAKLQQLYAIADELEGAEE